MRRRQTLDVEALARFRNDVLQLYMKFEEDLASISLKYGFEINMWYSPSKIPQPNFKAGNVLLDVDQLYDDGEFRQMVGNQFNHAPINANTTKSGEMVGKLDSFLNQNLTPRKEVRYKPGGLQTLLDGGGAFDFKQGDMDLRRKRRGRNSRYRP